MKHFAEEYPDFPFVQVPLAQLQEMPILQARLANFTVSADGEFVQVPLAQITWYHHISMFSKVKDTALRAFYMTETAIQGWSRDIMLMQISDGYVKDIQNGTEDFSRFNLSEHAGLCKGGSPLIGASIIACYATASLTSSRNADGSEGSPVNWEIDEYQEKLIEKWAKAANLWEDEQEKWYFSIVDVCDVLTDSKDPAAYWRKLKQRLKAERNETVTNCNQLKLRADDEKQLTTSQP